VLFRSEDEFWTSFGHKLRAQFLVREPTKDFPEIHSADDFTELFKSQNKDKLFGGKKVVLFVDEFDLIDDATDEVRSSLLNALRGLKQDLKNTCLQVR
jgi:hypothetical protein